MKNKDLILLDLFSGTGGFHKGLSDAGFNFKEIYYSEINKHAIANYKHNYPNAKHIGSVKNIIQSGIPRPHIITFGSPCQDFSLAGGRQGLAGNKSSLIQDAITAVTHFRPDIFIWENVKGTFSSNARRDFWAIIKAFADIRDYRLEWQLVNTSWLLPQNRERIYLIGHLTTAFRSWRNVFPVSEDERLSDIQSQSGQRQSQTQYCSTIRCGYGGRADDTYIQTGSVNKKENSINVAGRIWKGQDGVIVHDDGISPTICVGHGVVPKVLVNSGNKQGYEEAAIGDSIDLKSVNQKNRGKVNRKGIAPTLDTFCYQGVIQLNPESKHQTDRVYSENGIMCCITSEGTESKLIIAQRGRRDEKGKYVQQLEPRTDGITNTLTSVQKDNLLLDNSKIRRLTEIECERLQGFPDNWTQYGDYDGIVKPIPKTQRYKLLGNAVTAKMVEFLGTRLLTNYQQAEAIRLPLYNDNTDNRQAA